MTLFEPPRHPLHRLGHAVLFSFAILASLVLFVASLAPFIDPRYFVLPNLLALALPWWVVLNLMFLIYWAFRKRDAIWLPLLSCLFTVVLHVVRFDTMGATPEGASDPEHTLSALSYNVNLFRLYGWAETPPTPKDVAAFVAEHSPDVVCLQEFTTSDSLFTDSVARQAFLPHTHIFYTYEPEGQLLHHGLALFSRYPIAERGTLPFPDSHNAAIYADLVLKHDTLRVYNVHFQSFHLHRKNIKFIRRPYFFSQGEFLLELSEIFPKLDHTLKQQAEQVATLKAHIDASPHPVLVCGDFNATPFSYTYAQMATGLRDAFVEAGRGYGATFFTLPMPMRIDFMLHTTALIATDFEVVKEATYSDHLPIFARFRF